jgi:hypothetical protein
MLERRWYHPVLQAAMLALPRTYATVRVPAGTTVGINVEGDAGGAWTLVRAAKRWRIAALDAGSAGTPDAEVTLAEATAWRVLTRAAGAAQGAAAARRRGHPTLTEPVLHATAVMTTAP